MTHAPFPEMPVPDMLGCEGVAAAAARIRKALDNAADGGAFTAVPMRENRASRRKAASRKGL